VSRERIQDSRSPGESVIQFTMVLGIGNECHREEFAESASAEIRPEYSNIFSEKERFVETGVELKRSAIDFLKLKV